MVKLYYADVSAIPTEIDERLISSYRREKLEKQRSPLLRRQGIGAELLLQAALQELLPELTQPPEIAVDALAKPYLRGAELHFNLSHSGRYAACVIADRPVGVDIQMVREYSESLAERCFTPEERKTLSAAEEPDRAFTALWTLKESYLKWKGDGIRMPMRSVSVCFDLSAPLARAADAAFWHMRLQDYHLSVCVEAGEDPVPQEIKEVTLL